VSGGPTVDNGKVSDPVDPGRDGAPTVEVAEAEQDRVFGWTRLAVVGGTSVGRAAAGLARRAARLVGPHPVLVATLVVGALSAAALTAGSAEIYDAVAEGDGVAGLDRPVLRLVAAARTPQLNAAVTGFTHLGGPVGMSLLATVAAVALAIWSRRWTPIVLMAAAAAGSLLMTIVGKAAVGRSRPPLADAVAPYETSASFPSGHALNAVVVAGVVAYLFVARERHWRARTITIGVAAVFALAMGLSRVFLGHHWFTDVLVAWTLGLAWLGVVIVAHQLYLTVRQVRRARTSARTGSG
jgi:undecaprenyl-diphosphatase